MEEDMALICGSCGAAVQGNEITCAKCNTSLGSPVEESVSSGIGIFDPGPFAAAAGYRYHTEFVDISEELLGPAASGSPSKGITDRFNRMAEHGWELVAMSPIPVVGRMSQDSEGRTATLAVWRK
jgi:hypothetical protein